MEKHFIKTSFPSSIVFIKQGNFETKISPPHQLIKVEPDLKLCQPHQLIKVDIVVIETEFFFFLKRKL